MVFTSFPCGPLALHLTAADARLRDRVAAVLDLFTARWEPPATAVELRVIEAETPAAMARGTYLTCGRMHVDGGADALYATALSGASCRWAAGTQWTIAVPAGAPIPDDIEELLSLMLTTAWRQLGWVPLHAGAVVRDGCCALVTATSGGGKSTLVAALVRRGWQTLGDDKLLLRRAANGTGTVRALLHNFNLHPQVRGWFPEVGDLAARPVYSAWTDKRRVRAGEIWPGCERAAATPTHLVEVHRDPAGHGVRIEPLAAGDVLSSLLHQTVVPRDPATARPLLAAIAATAQDLRGVRATIASGAYSDPDCLAPWRRRSRPRPALRRAQHERIPSSISTKGSGTDSRENAQNAQNAQKMGRKNQRSFCVSCAFLRPLCLVSAFVLTMRPGSAQTESIMPSVSVVVPVLNGAATIGDLLAALASQAGAPAQCEIIVVDNGSTDGTQDLVRRFAVTLLDEPRRGPAAARNRGLRHARGEIVVHADADTLPTRGWLAAIVAPFAAADVMLVGGRTLAFRPATGAERFMAQSRVYETEKQLANPHFPFVPSLNMALRRDAALAIGGWAEELLTSEDVDLCHRLRQRFDPRMVYQPDAVLFHRHRATDAQLRRQAFTYGEGAAAMYRRYPEKVRWTLYTWTMVGTVLVWHTAQPLLLRGAHQLGWRTAEQLEHAVYQRLWTWSFWRGFVSYRRTGSYRRFEVPAT